MKTPPLAMTHDNFCAIVDPRSPNPKTETRRLLTLKGRTQEEVNEITSWQKDCDGNWIGHFGNTFGDLTELAEFTKTAYPKGCNKGIKSKYQIGDRCYLTEPTQIVRLDEFGDEKWEAVIKYFWHEDLVLVKPVTIADVDKLMTRKTGAYSKQIARFILKSFARYWVEIVDVKLERLLDITTEAAIAEGIERIYNTYDQKIWYWDYTKELFNTIDPIQSYLSEIAYIHKASKDRIGGWDLVESNPWLWVYKFKFIGNNNG